VEGGEGEKMGRRMGKGEEKEKGGESSFPFRNTRHVRAALKNHLRREREFGGCSRVVEKMEDTEKRRFGEQKQS